MEALRHPFFDELRQNPDMKLPNNYSLPSKLFDFCEAEKNSAPAELVAGLEPVKTRKEDKHDQI